MSKFSIRVAPKHLLIALYITIALFMVPFENATSGVLGFVFSYMDEFGAMFFFAWGCLYFFRDHHALDSVKILYVLFLVWGVICSAAYSTQPLSGQLIDFVCCAKYIMALSGMYCVGCNIFNIEYIKNALSRITKAITIVLFVYAMYELVTARFSMGVSLFGSHSVNTSHIGVGLVALLLFTSENEGKNRFWVLLNLLTIISSLTTKSFGIAIIIFVLVFFENLYKTRMKYILILFALIGVLTVGADALATYYLNDSSSRMLMTRNAIEIMLEKKGLGYGFAMYGSSQAAANYSPLYKALGYSHRYGMTASDPMYLTDSFWPTVMAQFGFVGLILMILLIVFQFKAIAKIINYNYNLYAAAMILLVYLCIMSFASSAFFNPIAVPYAIILGLILATNDQQNKLINT